MADYIDVTGLSRFKTKQDAYNLTKFASLSGGTSALGVLKVGDNISVDSNGVIKAGKLPADFGNKVISVHVVTSGSGENIVTKFYEDNNGAASTTEVAGEVGKIYIDLDSGSRNLYVYDSGSGEFQNFAANSATDSDIDSLFE